MTKMSINITDVTNSDAAVGQAKGKLADSLVPGILRDGKYVHIWDVCFVFLFFKIYFLILFICVLE